MNFIAVLNSQIMLSRPLKLLNSNTARKLLSRGLQQNLNTSSCTQVVPIQIDVPWGKIDGNTT